MSRRPLPVDEQPLRAEPFHTEQLQQYARTLAHRHDVDQRGGPDRLLPRLAENESLLEQAYRLISAAVAAKRHMSPADEWLLDNFYIVEEHIRATRRHLPRTYSRELPRLKSGPAAGFPRVYEMALALISHMDGRVTAESLPQFVDAYQAVTPLKIGELWAIPIMLRLALIENLRRVAARMTAARSARDDATGWADRLLETAERDPKSLIQVLAEMARATPLPSGEFVSEIARRLQGHPDAMAVPLLWLEQRLAEQAVTIEQLLQTEGQQQAADQVSIGNCINSLRLLGTMDWRDFVDAHSFIEQILRGVLPAGLSFEGAGGQTCRQIVQDLQQYSDVYAEMDFATRDRYRHIVERLARRSRFSEWEIAAHAVRLAREGRELKGPRDRTGHVGYFLVDRGLPQLEVVAQTRVSFVQRLGRAVRRRASGVYLGAIGLNTAALTALAIVPAWRQPVAPVLLLLMTVLTLFGMVHLSLAIVNWLATLVVAPHALPRMDYSDGIPAQCRALVAVPTLLSSTEDINDLLEALEVRYLANRDEHLHFALLTDWRDARSQIMPEDEGLLEHACRGIAALSEKYQGDRGDIFFLFHRPRRWNEQERLWMGFERKRGKLADLNAFLRGGPPDRFLVIVGDTASLRTVKYVITLDSDTQLPRDAARQLVATIAHPLNRPCVDPQKRVVADGYTILQPRVGLSFTSARALPFHRAVRRAARNRSLHAHGVRRLSGLVSRGVLHRQGHLRPRGFRARLVRPLPREPDPESRPDRRMLRAVRAGQRH